MSTWTAILLLLASNEPCQPCDYSRAGIALTQHFEGYSPFVYEDVGGKRTIGYGHLIRPGEHFPEPFLPGEATELLKDDIADAVEGVNRCVRVTLRQGQFDSLTDFAFNLGTGSLQGSTLLKRVNAGRHDDAAEQFLHWNRARVNGALRPVVGLTRRREAERDFFTH